MQLRGVRPFMSDKFDITKHKNYRFLSDAEAKNAFDIGQHINRKLEVKPNELYEMLEYEPPEDELPDGAFDDFEVDLEPL